MRKEAKRLGLQPKSKPDNHPECYREEYPQRVITTKPIAVVPNDYTSVTSGIHPHYTRRVNVPGGFIDVLNDMKPESFSPQTSFFSIDQELKDMPKGSIVVFAGDMSSIQCAAKTIHRHTQGRLGTNLALWHKGSGSVRSEAFGEVEAYQKQDTKHKYWNPNFSPPNLLVLDDIAPGNLSDNMSYLRKLMECMADYMILLVPSRRSAMERDALYIPKKIQYQTDYLFEFRNKHPKVRGKCTELYVRCTKNRKGIRIKKGFTMWLPPNV